MGELILHIGTTKTGSTALQQFFFENRETLVQHGICYPEFTQQPGPTRRRNGAFVDQMCLALTCGENPCQRVRDLDENRARLTETFASHNQVLLSDEDFSYSTGRLLDNGYSPEAYWTALAKTLFDAGAQNITTIVYLRRQDLWAASRWREEIRSGRCDQPPIIFCNRPGVRHVMDYANTIESLKAAFGKKAQIVVRRFSRATFEGGDIYRDFCAAAGIPWDDGYKLPKSDVNISLSFDVAEALRAFRHAAPLRTQLRTDILIPLSRKLSRENPDAPGTTPFNEGMTRALMAPYLEGNRLISEKYLGGEPPFSEEYGGRPVWVPNEERIAECRTAFEEAIEHYNSPPVYSPGIRNLGRKLPESVKRPFKAAGKAIFNR